MGLVGDVSSVGVYSRDAGMNFVHLFHHLGVTKVIRCVVTIQSLTLFFRIRCFVVATDIWIKRFVKVVLKMITSFTLGAS